MLRATGLASAGWLWNDDNLKCFKMDEKCQPLLDDLESRKTCDDNKEIFFKTWKESQETYMFKPKGDSILDSRRCRKYGRLQWLDPNNGYVKLMTHPERMWFQKIRGNNHYDILATMKSYDFRKQTNEQGENVEGWELTDDFYEYMSEYYKKSRNKCDMLPKRRDG